MKVIEKIQFKLKSIFIILLLCCIFLGILVWYNSCGLNSGFHSVDKRPPPVQELSRYSNAPLFIVINNGKPTTGNETVQLKLNIRDDLFYLEEGQEIKNYEMKISNNEDCMGGEWVSFKSEKEWTTSNNQIGKPVFISVRFKETQSQKFSECFSDSIIYDPKAPEIQFNLSQPKLTNREKMEFIFSGTDESNLQFDCEMKTIPNGVSAANLETDCKSPKIYDQLDPGEYVFYLTATDQTGNLTQPLTYHWEVENIEIPTVFFQDVKSLPSPITNNTSPVQFQLVLKYNPINIQVCFSEDEINCRDPEINEISKIDEKTKTLQVNYQPEDGTNIFKVTWGSNPSIKNEISYKWVVLPLTN